MKILLGTESFPPNVSGVAVATKNLAENLSKAGHQVFVFCPGSSFTTKVDRKYENFTVLRLRSIINPFRKGYRITFAGEKEIEEHVKKIKPDLIHLQDPVSIGLMLREVGHRNHIPVAITNHFSLEYALSYVKFMSPILPILRKGLIKYLVDFYNKCDYVLTPTETFKKQVQSWGVTTPIKAVSNGIETAPFQQKMSDEVKKGFLKKYHLPSNPLVLYLGRIDKDKSIDVLVKAIPDVIKKVNAHFIIAGSGGQLEEVKSLASDLGISDSITFIGFLKHDSPDFPLIYKTASLFAIPSTIETQSIVTLEALSASLPVVAANAGALPELVKDNINGYLFKPGDSKLLANHITKILSDSKLMQEMKKNSLQIALHHEMSRTFAEMEKTYMDIISENKKGPAAV